LSIDEQERRTAVIPKVTEIQTQREIEAQREIKIPKKTTQELIGLAQAQKAKAQAQDVTINIRTRKARRFKSNVQKQIDKTNAMVTSVLADADKYTSESIEDFKSGVEDFNKQAQDAILYADKIVDDLSKAEGVNKEGIQKLNAYVRAIQERPEEFRKAVRQAELELEIQQSVPIYTKEIEKGRLEPVGLPDIRVKPFKFVQKAWGKVIQTIDNVGKEFLEKTEFKSVEDFPLRSKGYDVTPQQIRDRLGWASSRVVLGGVKAVPYVLVGTAGAIVFGPLGAIFVPAVVVGITTPKVTTKGQKEKFEKYIKDHPEVWVDFALQGLGGIALASGTAKGYSAIRGKIQQRQLQKFYDDYPIEDFYVREEVLMQYPEGVDYYEVWKDTVLLPENTRILSDVRVPYSVVKQYKTGRIYKIGDEYGLVLTGNDAIPVYMPEGVGEPSVVYKPTDIMRMREIIDHVPGIRIQLEEVAGKGYYIPTWMGILGSGTKIGSKEIKKELGELGLPDSQIKKLLPQLTQIPELTLRDVGKLKNLKTPLEIQKYLDELLNRKDLLHKDLVENYRLVLITPDLKVYSREIESTKELQEEIQELVPIPKLRIPKLEEPTLTPPTPPLIGKKRDMEMRKFRIQLFRGPKSKFAVDFHYPRKEKQSVTVEARSYPEALGKAQRIRRITHELPNMVDMRRIK